MIPLHFMKGVDNDIARNEKQPKWSMGTNNGRNTSVLLIDVKELGESAKLLLPIWEIGVFTISWMSPPNWQTLLQRELQRSCSPR